MKALAAKRYVNVDGFDDADYVEFKQGAEKGRGYKDGKPCGPLHYTRREVESFVRYGRWREVPIPAGAVGVSRKVLWEEQLLALLYAWRAAAPGNRTSEIYAAVLAHIEVRVAEQRAAILEELLETLQRDVKNMKG